MSTRGRLSSSSCARPVEWPPPYWIRFRLFGAAGDAFALAFEGLALLGLRVPRLARLASRCYVAARRELEK